MKKLRGGGGAWGWRGGGRKKKREKCITFVIQRKEWVLSIGADNLY